MNDEPDDLEITKAENVLAKYYAKVGIPESLVGVIHQFALIFLFISVGVMVGAKIPNATNLGVNLYLIPSTIIIADSLILMNEGFKNRRRNKERRKNEGDSSNGKTR
jgi:putative effector of murein hydrolase LrgA (UPF0299 family)